jgi:ABC-type histidine transport system ATPase subunit
MENVCYPIELIGVDTKRAREKSEEYLLRVGITPEQMKRFPANLSGGEQQRVAIACILASGAKTLLHIISERADSSTRRDTYPTPRANPTSLRRSL